MLKKIVKELILPFLRQSFLNVGLPGSKHVKFLNVICDPSNQYWKQNWWKVSPIQLDCLHYTFPFPDSSIFKNFFSHFSCWWINCFEQILNINLYSWSRMCLKWVAPSINIFKTLTQGTIPLQPKLDVFVIHWIYCFLMKRPKNMQTHCFNVWL